MPPLAPLLGAELDTRWPPERFADIGFAAVDVESICVSKIIFDVSYWSLLESSVCLFVWLFVCFFFELLINCNTACY